MTRSPWDQVAGAVCTANRTKFFLRAALLLALAAACAMASAQSSDAGATPPPPARNRQHRSTALTIDDRVKIMTKTLELNEPQQAAVKRILLQRQQQTLQLRQDPSISGSERIERFRSLQVATVERIRAVLNDEQKQKYNPLAAEQIKSTPERSVEDWMKATRPK